MEIDRILLRFALCRDQVDKRPFSRQGRCGAGDRSRSTVENRSRWARRSEAQAKLDKLCQPSKLTIPGGIKRMIGDRPAKSGPRRGAARICNGMVLFCLVLANFCQRILSLRLPLDTGDGQGSSKACVITSLS